MSSIETFDSEYQTKKTPNNNGSTIFNIFFRCWLKPFILKGWSLHLETLMKV